MYKGIGKIVKYIKYGLLNKIENGYITSEILKHFCHNARLQLFKQLLMICMRFIIKLLPCYIYSTNMSWL